MMLDKTGLIKGLCRGEIPSGVFEDPCGAETSSSTFAQFLDEEELSCGRFLALFREQSSVEDRCRLYRDLGRNSLAKAARFLLHQTACDLLSSYNLDYDADQQIVLALTEDSLSSEWAAVGVSAANQGNDLLLTGEKKRVFSAEGAAAFVVLTSESPENSSSLFYVPSNCSGVAILGGDSSGGPLSLLKLDHVKVSEKSRVGEAGTARQIVVPFETRARLFWASACLGAAKRCLDQILCAAERTKRFAKPLAESLDLKKAVGRAFVQIKTLESAVHVTASLSGKGSTVNLEAIAAKCLADETLRILADLFDKVGGLDHLETGLWPERELEAALSHSFFGSRLFLNEVMALSATQDRRESAKESSRFSQGFKRMFSHPRIKGLPVELSKANRRLTEMVEILGHVSHKLLKVYGENFINEQVQHERLSGMITDVFAAFSLLYCAGLDNAEKLGGHLEAEEGVELIWERFVKRSGELYTTKHDDELASIGETLFSYSEKD